MGYIIFNGIFASKTAFFILGAGINLTFGNPRLPPSSLYISQNGIIIQVISADYFSLFNVQLFIINWTLNRNHEIYKVALCLNIRFIDE